MLSHLNRKVKCSKENPENLTDDEIFNLSLVPISKLDESGYKFRCKICEKKFRDNCDLTRHKKACESRLQKKNTSSSTKNIIPNVLVVSNHMKKDGPMIEDIDEKEEEKEEEKKKKKREDKKKEGGELKKKSVHVIYDLQDESYDFSEIDMRERLEWIMRKENSKILSKIFHNPINEKIYMYKYEKMKYVEMKKNGEEEIEIEKRMIDKEFLRKKILFSFYLDTYLKNESDETQMKYIYDQLREMREDMNKYVELKVVV